MSGADTVVFLHWTDLLSLLHITVASAKEVLLRDDPAPADLFCQRASNCSTRPHSVTLEDAGGLNGFANRTRNYIRFQRIIYCQPGAASSWFSFLTLWICVFAITAKRRVARINVRSSHFCKITDTSKVEMCYRCSNTNTFTSCGGGIIRNGGPQFESVGTFPNHDVLKTLTRWFMCLNLNPSRGWALCCDRK